MTKTILVLLFAPYGRDPEAIYSLIWYVEKIFKYNIKIGSVFDGIYLIDKYRPDAVLFPNIGGAETNIKIANYAYDHNIIVITLTSEGLFRKSEMSEFIWGNNVLRKKNWHKMFVWSKKCLKMAQEYLPEYKNSFDVSGSTGIDRYKIYNFMDKQTFLKRYKKIKYKKIIMYGGFTFGNFFNKKFNLGHNISQTEIDFYNKEMNLLKNILCQMITNNKDILFILKKHPAEHDSHMEIDDDWKFDNILIFNNQEEISNLICISDIYFVYRSTSSFEAYTLKKTVVNIFPTQNISKVQPDQLGNCLIKTYNDAQKIINEYYKAKEVKCFVEKSKIRNQIIKNYIGCDDGKNSWRTAQKIDKFLKFREIRTPKIISFKGLIFHLIFKFNYLLKVLPRFRHSLILEYFNSFDSFFEFKKKYDPQIERFYNHNIKNDL